LFTLTFSNSGFSGLIDEGETPEQAASPFILARSISFSRTAVRELKEETGYKDAEILTASSEVRSP
jgi:8-oxo-dGTP pyrophosphatase MutT (NUDIX family)